MSRQYRMMELSEPITPEQRRAYNRLAVCMAVALFAVAIMCIAASIWLAWKGGGK